MHFRSTSVGLLITTRYLSEDSSFYEVAEDYIDYLLCMNEQLALWEQFPKSTTKWFLGTKVKSETNQLFKKYKKMLDTAQKKLITSC